MAQKIITICDVHLHEAHEDVSAETYPLVGMLVDLCDEHAQMPLLDAVHMANMYGRRAENGSKPKPKPKAKNPPKVKTPKPDEAKADEPTCPHCGLTRPTVRGVNAHIGQKHKGKELLS